MLFLERHTEKSKAPFCMTNNKGHRYDQSSESAWDHVQVAEIIEEKKEGEYI